MVYDIVTDLKLSRGADEVRLNNIEASIHMLQVIYNDIHAVNSVLS